MHRTLTLEQTIYTKGQLLVPPGPQTALAGRSNVGKSSCINTLAGRKSLARISSTPGKTRSLNFYKVTPGDWWLVDLPGYGYARTSKKERQYWAELIEAYVQNNKYLAAVGMLIDSRHPPQKLDLELAAYVQGLGLQLIPILTKADKTKQKEHAERRREWKNILGGRAAPLLFSAKTGVGKETLWQALEQAARGVQHQDTGAGIR